MSALKRFRVNTDTSREDTDTAVLITDLLRLDTDTTKVNADIAFICVDLVELSIKSSQVNTDTHFSVRKESKTDRVYAPTKSPQSIAGLFTTAPRQ